MKNKILLLTFFAFIKIYSLNAQFCSASSFDYIFSNDCEDNSLLIFMNPNSTFRCAPNITYDIDRIKNNIYIASANINFNSGKIISVTNTPTSLGYFTAIPTSNSVSLSASIDYGRLNFLNSTPNDSIKFIELSFYLPLTNYGTDYASVKIFKYDLLRQHNSTFDSPNTLNVNEIGKYFNSSNFEGTIPVYYKWSSSHSATFDRTDTNIANVSWSTTGKVDLSLYLKRGFCESLTSHTVFIKSLTGLDENSKNNITFNNPVVNKELTFSDVVESVLITTLDGKQILNANNTNFVKVNLPQGLYILAVNGKPTKLVVE